MDSQSLLSTVPAGEHSQSDNSLGLVKAWNPSLVMSSGQQGIP